MKLPSTCNPKSHLESSNGSRLEPEVGLEVLGNLPHQTLEGQLPDEELGGLLVPPDLTEGDGAGAVPMGLLDSARRGRRLPGSLGGELLPGGLASGGLTGGLLCTGHGWLANLDWLPKMGSTFVTQLLLPND